MSPEPDSTADSPDVNYRGAPSATPLVEATSMEHESPEQLESIFASRRPGHLYTRLSNPTLSALEQKLAELEAGLGAAATASGMAAIAGTMLVLARPGDNIVASSQLFGGTNTLFKEVLADYGLQVKPAHPAEPSSFEQAIDSSTRLLFVETITNPGLRVPDLEELGRVAGRHDLPLVVDSTVTTPRLVRPGSFGAGLVLHSTTKYLNGHGDAVGGCVVDTGQFDWAASPYLDEELEQVGDLAFLAAFKRRAVRTMGMCQSPAAARSTLKGMESLGPRLDRHCENATQLAGDLTDHPAVKKVSYPGLERHPDYEVSKRIFNGAAGAIITLRLGSKERCFEFLNGLDLVKNMVNIGDTTSMALHPASTICRDFGPGERRDLGVHDDLVRICVGIEQYSKLKNDVTEALNRL